MTYATQQDLVDRFGEAELIQLTDRADPPLEAIDATVVAKALADADDEITAYVAVRYAQPLDPVPNVLKRVACDIARYYLFADRVTDQVKTRYDAAVKFLRSVASGDVSLGVDSAGDVPSQEGGADFNAGDRTFTIGRPSTGAAGSLDDYLG